MAEMIEIKLTRRSLADRIRYIADKYTDSIIPREMLRECADEVDGLIKALEHTVTYVSNKALDRMFGSGIKPSTKVANIVNSAEGTLSRAKGENND